MGKHRSKVIAAAVILVALVGAWFWGGSFFGAEDSGMPASAYMAQGTGASSTQAEGGATVFVPDQVIRAPGTGHGDTLGTPEGDAPSASRPETAPGGDGNTGSFPSELPPADPSSPEPPTDPSTSQPPALPPAEPQVPGDDGTFTVTLTVRADTILRNMHLLDSAKHALVPPNGVIFPATEVTVTEGENVFDVLQREMRRGGIHMVSRFTPMYNSVYIVAIHNLYEFDVGPLSGWMYRVNGSFPGFGASQYILRPGDVIEWLYTVDLGRDIGGGGFQ